jgi:hypothetical protein
MPTGGDDKAPDMSQIFGYVAHMMGDPKMQKNIEAITKQIEQGGVDNLFSNMQKTFEQMNTKPK